MPRFFKTPVLFSWIFPRRVWGFNSSNSVFLTFDDGPTPQMTRWILKILKEKQVKATFFCVGTNAKNHADLIGEILSDEHALGNHTMHHEKGTSVTKKEYVNSIEATKKYIKSTLFRPPYGRLPLSYERKIAVDFKIIMWSWLSYDFDPKITVEKILNKADKQIKPGDILLLHDNAKNELKTKELLPKLIDLIKSKGYHFETISS